MKTVPSIPTESYPLTWPAGAPRTPATERRDAPFCNRSRTVEGWEKRSQLTVGEEIRRVRDEVDRIPFSSGLVISTDLPTRGDGMPMASASEAKKDPGVAVYWYVRNRGGRGSLVPYAMPCDTYKRIADNLHAIALSIEAMRGLDRWGAVKLEQAFAGFTALPPGQGAPATARPWRDVLGGVWPGDMDAEEVYAIAKARHRKAIAKAHPDAVGDADLAVELNLALADAEAELLGDSGGAS